MVTTYWPSRHSGRSTASTPGGGDDAVAIRASVANSVYTGSGSDALTIEADVVESVYTGATSSEPAAAKNASDDDAVAIRARSVDSVYTGAGRDAVAIEADLVSSIYTGADGDSLSVTAGAVHGIHTEGGDDTVVIDAVMGSSRIHVWDQQGYSSNPSTNNSTDDTDAAEARIVKNGPVRTWSPGEIAEKKTADAAAIAGTEFATLAVELKARIAPQIAEQARAAERTPEEAIVAQRLREAQAIYADVHLGAGNDALSVRVDEVISVKGGRGDDSIAIGGGTVALHYEAGDGNDRISVAAGASVAVQLQGDMAYSASWDGDALVLQLGNGSMRIDGAAKAAAIGVMKWGGREPAILHMAPPLDRTA
ncbi:hypothetical protein [uncultured Jannaschia sp.]|uniref:hypothetical protein n=1 Tax=uncultured Jannaschia sp. TaxID=293347 RepID=UPI00262BE667|nr:hypothetical protein [uncultured Jannaschia sp.]